MTRKRWHHYLADGLTVLGLGIALVGLIGVVTTKDASAASGTIKVHTEADCGGQDNDPKVGQQFWVSGTNFGASLDLWLAVTDGTNASDPVVIGPTHVGTGGAFCAGPYTLPAGHYKVFVGLEGPVQKDRKSVV